MEEIRLVPPMGAALTASEEQHLAVVFRDNPIIAKYLHLVLWTLITDNANIPLPTISADLQENALKQAYVKGGISVLHMLLSITAAPAPVQPQAPQQQQVK